MRHMDRESIDLLILGGFLGSGKTTLLNHLLGRFEDTRIGIVVNDFGKLGVDASLVEQQGEEEVVELNGGQIFCSCISGNFVKSIETLSRKPIDLILVESSGLAKPSALGDIVEEACRTSEEKIRYRGFVSVVDAERVSKLIEVVNAVEEQIVYADLVVINKTDLSSPEELEEVRRIIEATHPEVPVAETTHGEISPDVLPQKPLDHGAAEASHYAGWGDAGRPKAVTWLPRVTLSPGQLEKAVRRVAENAYRIKGHIRTTEGLRYVSVSGNQISITEAKARNAAPKASEEAPVEASRQSSRTQGTDEGLSVIVPPRVITSKIFKHAEEEVTAGE
jgi:G3E family GTPase